MSTRDIIDLKEANTFDKKVEAIVNRYTKLLDTNYIYYNVNIYNSTRGDIPAIYQEVRTAPILDRASDWELAVDRFTVPVDHLPIFMFSTGTYNLTLNYANTDFTTTLTFFPSALPPNNNNGFIYYVQQFLSSINVAFQTSLATLTTANPSVVTTAPLMIYNPVTALFTLQAPATYYGLTSTSSPITVWFNTALYRMFETLQAYYNDFTPLSKNFQIVIQDFGYNNSGGTISMTVDSPCIGVWNTLQSLIFLSTGLPTQPELIGSNEGGSSANLQLKYLADFEIPVQNTTAFSAVANIVYQYNPVQYRWIDLKGDAPLYAVDLQCYYQLIDGTQSLLQIESGRAFTVKLIFRRKTVLTTT